MIEVPRQEENALDVFEQWAGQAVGLPKILEFGRDSLRRKFAVEDLSTIEAAHLKAEALAALESFADCLKRKSPAFHIGNEIAYRWLQSCYGVPFRTIDEEFSRGVSNEFKEWLFRSRFRAHAPEADNQMQDEDALG